MVNKVILVGNLGDDPEVRHFENGSVARVSLATSETYKDKNGERQKRTEWHNVEMWNGLAKVAEQYLKKGNQIYVEGRITYDSWNDDQGNPRKTTKIRALSMTMMGSKNDNQQNNGYANNTPTSDTNKVINSTPAPINTSSPDDKINDTEEMDDLPF